MKIVLALDVFGKFVIGAAVLLGIVVLTPIAVYVPALDRCVMRAARWADRTFEASVERFERS